MTIAAVIEKDGGNMFGVGRARGQIGFRIRSFGTATEHTDDSAESDDDDDDATAEAEGER